MAIAHWRGEMGTETYTEQSVLEHLHGTACLASCFASAFHESEIAKAIAMAHDIGKYSVEFQNRIKGAKREVDHATCGARTIYGLCRKNPVVGTIAAYCIAGHHGGLPNGGSSSQSISDITSLYYRIKDKPLADYSSYANDIQLTAIHSLPTWNPGKDSKTENIGFSLSFLIRILFSCLVDADWLDTERFMTNGAVHRGSFDSIDGINNKLIKHLKKFDNPTKEINKKRNALRNDCVLKAQNDRGLFTLTAPTGSGKTLSSMAFALNHAVRNNMRRIIYVIPYNTIIEQNAKEFEKIFGADNIVQHHSHIEYEDTDPRRFATENWDAPIIVTSTVQFFESLFSNKPSKCRKLHNIVNSVIVFDEAQMLPLLYLIPCTAVIGELVKNCNCTAVLATATQSSLNNYFKPLAISEINSQPEPMYEDFRRVTYHIEDSTFSDDRLVTELSTYHQVLCIVNTRKKAQQLASLLPNSDHLSTTMYPVHRKKVLDKIHEKLKNGKPCRVISTSLIEAGVDIDFPVLYREKAGLDSVIQAAGRCNREGKNPAHDSIVHVFTFADNRPPVKMQQNISAFEHAKHNNTDIASLQAVTCYFEKLRYFIGVQEQDIKNVVTQFNDGVKKDGSSLSFPFKTVAGQFHLIENDQKLVIVDTMESKPMCDELRAKIRNRNLLRRIQQFGVNLYQYEFDKLQKYGFITVLDDGIAIMDEQNYDGKYGVSLQPDCGNAIII